MPEPFDIEATEFHFPLHKVPEDLKNSSWAEMLQGLDSNGVLNFLAWSLLKPQHPGIAAFQETLLTYLPVSICYLHGQSYVCLKHPDFRLYDPDFITGRCYLAEPPPPGDPNKGAAAVLKAHGGKFAFPEVLEFFESYCGLRYCLDSCGNFQPPHEWKSLSEIMSRIIDCSRHDSWQSAVSVYAASNGDFVILHESGAVAWYCLSEDEIFQIGSSFTDLLKLFHSALSKFEHLDSYFGRN